jgi:hypothetical protein
MNGMIDKLDCGIPVSAPYTREFAKILSIADSPEWARASRVGGQHYHRRTDLRELSGGELPVILHRGNTHDSRADDKVELIETAKYKLSELKDVVRSMYIFAPDEARVLRLDAAADVRGTSVDWFHKHTYPQYKQTHRAWVENTISQRHAQTLLAGQKPRQLRIYDKTGHRASMLDSETRKMSRPERVAAYGGTMEQPGAMTFEDRWGYPRTDMVTRVERQMGGGEPKTMGYERIGSLYKLSFGDPFERIIFPEDSGVADLDTLKNPNDRLAAEALRDRARRFGVQDARDYLYSCCKWRKRDVYYRLWKRFRPFVMATDEDVAMTHADLQRSFLSSLEWQLAA